MNDMNLEQLLTELKEEKIDARQVTLTKNGVVCKGIRVSMDGTNVAPIIYYSRSDTMDELYARVHRAIAMSDSSKMDDLVKRLRDWDYVERHVVPSICRDDAADPSWIRRDYLDLTVSMRVMLDADNFESAGIYITQAFVDEMIDALSQDAAKGKGNSWVKGKPNAYDGKSNCLTPLKYGKKMNGHQPECWIVYRDVVTNTPEIYIGYKDGAVKGVWRIWPETCKEYK